MLDAVVQVADPGDLVLVDVKWGFCVTVVLSVQWQSVELLLDVVSQNVKLRNSAVEGLGGWHVSDVTQTENVVVLNVLKGSWVDVQQSG